MTKTRIFQFYFSITGIFLLFWWPLSHWFYADWYHSLLGFESYDKAMAQVIGTLSLFSVFGIFFVVKNPLKNRDFFITLLIISVLMSATYGYLVENSSFPKAEVINIILLIGNAIIASLLYPWRDSKE